MNSFSFSEQNLVNLEPIEWPLNSVFTNKYGKYNTDREITNTYKNLQIVQTQFFTDKLIFIYIGYNLNIYWFIGIQIRLVQ